MRNKKKKTRKEFIKKGLLGGASLGMAPFMTSGDKILSDNKNLKQPAFNMKFFPDFNVFNFEGSYREKLEWGYEMGFRAWENTWFIRRTEEEKKEIQETMERLGMEFGQFVGTSTFKDVTFAGRDEALREKVLEGVGRWGEVAKRMNTKNRTMGRGRGIPQRSVDWMWGKGRAVIGW